MPGLCLWKRRKRDAGQQPWAGGGTERPEDIQDFQPPRAQRRGTLKPGKGVDRGHAEAEAKAENEQ